MDLKDKIVTIIGLGKSGRSAARLLIRHGARVRISDKAAQCQEDFLRWAKDNQIDMELGGHTRDFMEASDLVIVSPGIKLDQDCVRWTRAAQIPLWGELELASRFCNVPMIAITGSNGKTTVATLIGDILSAARKKVKVCGNIGYPLTDVVLEEEKYDFVIVEVSSFQLETIKTFKPHIAVFLNFSQNHLDWHNNLDEYFNAKKRIFMNQDEDDYAVLNKKDPKVAGLEGALKGQVRFFNTGSYPETEIGHNPDYVAAFCVGRILGLDVVLARSVIENFGGVEHRLEKVRVLNGVQFINDSKATTAEAARWALESLDRPIIMICGGKDKNIDFTGLRDLVRHKVKKMFLIGEARSKLKDSFSGLVPVEESLDLKQAILNAAKEAKQGDAVLLSPMCASFDMFENFEHRGRSFKEIVNTL